MKVEIRETTPPVVFVPYEITIKVESYQDERILAELYNHHSQVAELVSKYINYNQGTRVSSNHSINTTFSEVSLMIRDIFSHSYGRVFQMKKLILLRGLPGSGKTTFANFLMDYLLMDITVCMFAADDYFTEEDGTYKFDANKLGSAHAQCERNTKQAMIDADEETIILVHNTFTTEKELKPYLALAKEYNFDVTTLVIENRHGNKSVHGVPEEVMAKMKARFSLHV